MKALVKLCIATSMILAVSLVFLGGNFQTTSSEAFDVYPRKNTETVSISIDTGFVPHATKNTVRIESIKPPGPGCLQKIDGEKYALVKSTTSNLLRRGVYYWADDGCVLGHFTKDAAMVFSILIEMGNATQRSPIIHIILGNKCASSTSGTPLYKHVLKHWFVAIGLDRIKLVHFDEVPRNGVQCYESLILRPKWRWFRVHEHAIQYRLAFWKYFEIGKIHVVKDEERDYQSGNRRLRVTIIRRTKNRHFQEHRVAQWVTAYFSDVVENVTVVELENMPSYRHQVLLLSSTDVLIAAHGAALSSMVALPPWSAVVELFAHGFRYMMFEELAWQLDHVYYPVEGTPSGRCCGHPRNGKRDHSQNVPFYDAVRNLNGFKSCKNCDIDVTEDVVVTAVRSVIGSVLLRRASRGNVNGRGSNFADRRN